MTHDEFLSLLKQPESVVAEHVADLKEMVDVYPYFAPARLFHAKALQKSNSILFASNLKFSALFASNRHWLYYYIHPDKKISVEPFRRDKSTKSSGDYFDMINNLEESGGDTKQTLKNLAERLKSARSMVTSTKERVSKPVLQPTVEMNTDLEEKIIQPEVKIREINISTSYFDTFDTDYSELKAKNLIREHKYTQAIEILRDLNLNNPKKSVYFADQIRFLEKVIVNSKN